MSAVFRVNSRSEQIDSVLSGCQSPPPPAPGEQSVLFGQLSTGLRPAALRADLMDGRTEEPQELADEQTGTVALLTWKQLVTLKLLID